ncbi:hypothetical protein L3Q82_019506 [Scortum barcoo]|uniref:Uncharacterized protein n=1 Tax=Scortum barcoo TaxID=214431 RepID=A0ACB8VBB5_9TELE|nr:hypothetical protein L3Q82_019506 [Scortum barcoo]
MNTISILFSVDAVRCEDPKIRLSVQEGEVVNIPCRYDSGYENYPKYFSKGIYADRKKIKSTDKTFKEMIPEGKYSLWDDTKERVLRVTIHYVTLSDAGTYWCEIDTYTFDPKTEIKLKVYKGKKLHLAVAAAAAVLLVCLLVVLYLRLGNHRQDERRVRRAVIPLINTSSTQLKRLSHRSLSSLQGSHGDHHYEDIQVQTQQAGSKDALPSIYAVINPPTDQLHYASVSFQEDSVCALPDTDKNGSSTCDYSSISMAPGATYPPAPEQSLYSSVAKPRKP